MKKIREYYLRPFIGGFIALIMFCFLLRVNSFEKGLIITLTGSILFTLVFGTILLIFDKFVRPKVMSFFLKHKNIKSLEKIGLFFNDKMNGYHGTYKNYDVQVICHYEKVFFSTEYIINIVFKKVDTERIKKLKIKPSILDAKMIEFAIQRIFQFKILPPSYEKMVDSIDNMIEYLTENNFEPIKLDELKNN